ncbi:MAG: ABC transporter ATP-binding protein [Chloroflexi bacterium]|nr:ABC transporter ATP-binding protein [Chloroflexota bacterium]
MSQTASPAAEVAAPAHLAPAVETVGLRKEYGRKVALHGLDLTVQPGEVFGFLGPNGAGKTTTVKILLGLVAPTAGAARIFGRAAGDPAARRQVGYLPENFRFHDWLTGNALLEFHARLAGMTAEQYRERIPAVLDLVGLSGRGDDRIRSYSKGMTQRIGIAQAIVHEPELVLLDEPTSALDPVGRREVRDLIRFLTSRGTTVFLNSHLLSEVELVCDRVAIVDHGRVVRGGRLDDLVGGGAELRITLDRIDAAALELLRKFGAVVDVSDCTVTLSTGALDVAPRVAEAVFRAGYRLYALTPSHQSLEDVFLSLVQSTSDR